MQLELASRQLAEETEESAAEHREDIEAEMATLKRKLASLREQWEAEKLGVGDVQKLRKDLDRVNLEYSQLEAQIKERQSAGIPPSEDDYQKLLKLYNQRQTLEKQIDASDERVEEKPTEKRLLRQEVTEDEIAEIVSAWTGIPVSRMLETEKAKLLVMEERLHQRVVGQDEAVVAVSAAVRRSRSGLQDPNRPIGSFLFLGPTGVGKTELCKALAEVMFDSDEAVVRIDMSEFGEKHNVSRLIGAPPGYVGYEEGGVLTEAVRRRPYAVVLLDEIEKAHRDVFNVLLQVLDDGRLTDGQGRTVDFTNTIVVMTSNIGSQMIQQITSEGGKPEEIEEALRNILKEKFLPEFLNRIDETIVFHPLTRDQIAKIVDLQLNRFAKLLEERDLRLEVTPSARHAIATEGYDPTFGARPLKRVIQQRLQNPLATELLKGHIPDHGGIRVDYRDEEFVFEPLPPATPTGASRHDGKGKTKVETVGVS